MRILVVEDDAFTARVITRLVEGLGHQVEACTDAEQAWGLLQHTSFDAVLCDWLLPGASGADLCARLRDRDPYTPFLYVTGITDRASQLEGMRAGAFGYMTKPVERHELAMNLLAIERVLDLHRKLAAREAELKRRVSSLQREAHVDAVTGIPNRASFDAVAPEWHERAVTTGQPYALAFLDIDHFKAYNDLYGHPAGDVALHDVAEVLTATSRRSDQVFRHGGEEFAMLLQSVDQEAAGRALERVRAGVQASGHHHPGNDPGTLTVSAGFAVFDPGGATSLDDLIRRADRALYRAKARGRNRVEGPRELTLTIGLASPAEIPACKQLRHAVFVDEQGVPASIEDDGRDSDSLHALARVDDHPVGTARLRVVDGKAKAERVAVLPCARGLGVGAALMDALESAARAQGHGVLLLNAQLPVVPFYERLGYTPEGPIFMEAGIPHRAMRRALA